MIGDSLQLQSKTERRKAWRRLRKNHSISAICFGIVLLPFWWPLKKILKGFIFICGKTIDCAYWLDDRI